MTSGTLNSNETNDHLSTTNDRSFEVIEIEKLKAKLNAFSSKLSANTLLVNNFIQEIKYLYHFLNAQ